jgi:hypothetical protein
MVFQGINANVLMNATMILVCYDVLTAVTMNIAFSAMWGSVVMEVYRCRSEHYSSALKNNLVFLRNIGKPVPYYTEYYP